MPEDPTIVNGQVQIQGLSPSIIQILQSTPRAIINWSSFNIGNGETVRFLQPGSSAAILNRVTGIDPSTLNGLLQANGRVFLLNPNGILFGPNSVVDVGSFMASTLTMSDADFLAGRFNLSQDPTRPLTALVNQGSIQVSEGGFVVLVSPLLENSGAILAQSGQVNLGASRQASFSLDGRGQVHFLLPDGFNPQFTGGGEGGTVLLTQSQTSQLLREVVGHPRLVEAGSLRDDGQRVVASGAEGVLVNSGTITVDGAPGQAAGSIRLDSSQATVHGASGRLSANGQNGAAGDIRVLSVGKTMSLGAIDAAANGRGDGGFAEVSGHSLWLHGPVNVSSQNGESGTILLDPGNITIVDAGGTLDGSLPTVTGGAGDGSVTTTAMGGHANVLLDATNNITYNGAGFNLPGTNLTVTAGNDIAITTPAGSGVSARGMTLQAVRDLTITSPGSVTVEASNGNLNLSAGRNVTVNSGGNTFVRATGANNITAGNNIDLGAEFSSSVFLDGATIRLNAGQDALISANRLRHGGASGGVVINATRDFRANTPAGGAADYVLAGLNITAGRDITGSPTAGFFVSTNPGSIDFTAGRNITITPAGGLIQLAAPVNQIRLNAQQVNLDTGTGPVDIRGRDGVDIRATAGNLSTRAQNGNTAFVSAAGPVLLLASAGNTSVAAPFGSLQLAGTTATVNASQDTLVQIGSTATVDGSAVNFLAGRNLTLATPNTVQSANTNILASAGQDLRLVAGGAVLSASGGNLTYQAGQDLSTSGSNQFFLSTTGNLVMTAGRNLSIDPNHSLVNLLSTGQQLRLQGANVTLTPATSMQLAGQTGIDLRATTGNLTASSPSFLNLDSNAGPVNVSAPLGNVSLSAASGLRLASPTQATVQANQDVVLQGQTQLNLNSPIANAAAGRNLTVRTQLGSTLPNTQVNLSALNDLTISPVAVTSMQFTAGAINATAGQNMVISSTLTNMGATAGNLNLVAGNNLEAGNFTQSFTATGRTNLQAANLTLRGSGTLDVRGQQVDLRASNDLSISNLGAHTVNATVGALNLEAGRNLTVTGQNNDLIYASPTLVNASAGNNALFSTAIGSVRFEGPNTRINAGQNFTIVASGLRQNVALGNLNITGSNVTLQSLVNGNFFSNTGNLNVTATQDVLVNAVFSSNLTTQNGDLSLRGGRNVTVNAGNGEVGLVAVNGNVLLTGANVTTSGTSRLTIRGGRIDADATQELRMAHSDSHTVNATTGPLNLSAGGNLSASNIFPAAPITYASPTSINVTAANSIAILGSGGAPILLESPDSRLTAGQNVTLTTSQLRQLVTPGNLAVAAGQNLRVGDTGTLLVSLGALNATAGQDASVNATFQVDLSANNGNLTLAGGRNTTISSGSPITVSAPNGNVSLSGANLTSNSPSTLTVTGRQVDLTATTGDLGLFHAGTIALNATNGPLGLSAGRNMTLTNFFPNVNVTLASPIRTDVTAGNSVNIAVQGGSSIHLEAPDSRITAGQNLTLTGGQVRQTVTPGNVALTAGQDAVLTGPNNLVVNVTGLNVTAGRDVTTNSTLATNISANNGNLTLSGGRNLNFSSGSNPLDLASSNGNLTLRGAAINTTNTLRANSQGAVVNLTDPSQLGANSVLNTSTAGIAGNSSGNLSLTGLNLTTTGPIQLNAANNLTVGPLGSPNVSLSGGNIIVQSMQNVTGGNYTFNTTGNLTELVAATNPANLNSLNITTGRIFGTGTNSSFSIPNTTTGQPQVLITAGNDTVFNASGSMRQFNAASIALNTTVFTGDIYIDGILVFRGSPPPPAPPPPPSPPPPVEPVPQQQPQPQQQSGLTPDQRAEILAQSNLALGNLGSFSRVLEPEERDRFTVQLDGLRQTFPLDPFSPTLALVVPANRPLVPRTEWLELEALYSEFNDNLREKDRAAYNAMVDQEVREIWEVRYWRHLLEGFVIWEDSP